MNSIIKSFAKKWGLPEQTVLSIYRLIQDNGGKYGKSHRALKHFGLELSVRQIRYFYKKVRLHERIDFDRKGRPANYQELLKEL